jgi:hypothetical protein
MNGLVGYCGFSVKPDDQDHTAVGVGRTRYPAH